jgi:hypothetical protein
LLNLAKFGLGIILVNFSKETSGRPVNEDDKKWTERIFINQSIFYVFKYIWNIFYFIYQYKYHKQ